MAIRLTYHTNIYCNAGMKNKKLDKIKKKLESGFLLSSYYLIALSRNPIDQLEVYDGRQLVQSYYKKNPPYVVGIAESYDDAIELVQVIVKECLDKRGDCNLKEYLLCQE